MPEKRVDLLIIAVYAVLSLFMTYPLIEEISTKAIGVADVHINLWNLWWVKKAVASGQTPYFSDYIMHPTGTSLAFHTLTLFNSLLAVPLQELLGMAATYNLLCLLTFVLSAYGMFLLAKYLTGDNKASFVAGLIFAFCPYRFAHLFAGHLNLVSTQFIPFYALYLIKTIREPGNKNPLLAGVFLFLTSLCCWHYMVHSMLFTALFLFYEAWFNRNLDLAVLKRLAGMSLLFSALIFPFAYPLIAELPNSNYRGPLLEFAITFSADVFSFLTPSSLHSVFGAYTSDIYNRFSGNIAENTLFAGYMVLLLSAYYVVKKDPLTGFIKERVDAARKVFDKRINQVKALSILLFLLVIYKFVFNWDMVSSAMIFLYSISMIASYYVLKEKKIGFWTFSASVFFVLSLGPIPHIYGEAYMLALPGMLFPFIPGLSFLRDPARFGLLVVFCLSVMAAFSLKMIFERTQKKNLLATIVSCIILFEFLTVPNAMTPMETPAFYDWLAEQPGDFAIVDFPVPGFRSGHADYMYYQTKHEKRIVGGYISIQSEDSRDFCKNTPVIQAFEDPVALLEGDHLGDNKIKLELVLNAYLKPPKSDYAALRELMNGSNKAGFSESSAIYIVEKTPWLAAVMLNQTFLEGDILKQNVAEVGMHALGEYNIRYVVVHRRDLEFMGPEGVDIVLEEMFPGKDPVYADDELEVYEVPEGSGSFAALGANWFLKEPFEPFATRWMSNDATILLSNAAGVPVNLTFEARGFEEPKTLAAYLNGESLGEYLVEGEYSKVRIENIALQEGENTLLFHAQEGCEKQVDEYLSGAIREHRCVSVAFRNVSFTAF